MPGFDYKFLEKPKRRLLCPLCGKPMREPVQVSTCGHRFCDTCLQEFLRCGPGGEGTHLSLYIRVLPGAFDNLLEWPFARRVTFSLLDQSDPGLAKPQHVTETFHPDPNWKNFQKPGTWRGSLDESALGFGYPKFISHQDIRKRNYVRDDAVFIRASVELPRKILS
uniref:TNF receptor associated factor 4 n=1 Tax=Capra hircus TaxID=9925 RepID=A0A452F6J2_CAPHI